MSYVDALKMVENVRRRLVDLAVSENYVRDPAVSDILRRVWAEGGSGLVSDLWVEGTLPGAKSEETLSSLAMQNLFPRDLRSHIAANGAFPTDVRLFTHQVEALRATGEESRRKPTLAIAAGTGQGKTEAFLLPLLRDLWFAPRERTKGMRALILYPLNALVADQIERIYSWLRGQARLSVFHFTSETPESKREADREEEPEWESCRMRTRDEARGHETHDGRRIPAPPYGPVPDIVITNYSMLEYMLCRPQDDCFFGQDLRCIILDEAHLYTGALAAEIAMLLRRVRERCGVLPENVLQVATSATLGGTDEELRQFSSKLFSVDTQQTHVIRGQPGEPDIGLVQSPPATETSADILANSSEFELTTLDSEGKLVENAPPEAMQALSGIVTQLVANDVVAESAAAYPATPARFLYSALRKAPLVHKLAVELLGASRRIQNVDSLAGSVFPAAERRAARQATVLLLRLTAAARNSAGEMPLVPHRLHFLVRAPDGLSVCLNGECSGPANLRPGRLGCVQNTSDRCRYCRHVTLPLHRCQNCGEWALAGHESDQLLLEPAWRAPTTSRQTFYLFSRRVAQGNEGLPAGAEVVVDTMTGERRGHGATGTALWKAPSLRGRPGMQCCPTCVSEWTPSEDSGTPYGRQTCCPLVGGRSFAPSVVAETVLHDLPPYQDASRNWKPAQGRRLLCFSDSRREAARLGPRLTRQHEIRLVRAAIARAAREHASQDAIPDIEDDIARLRERVRLATAENNRVRLGRARSELQAKEDELRMARAGVPFCQFARLVAQRPEIRHILHRDKGDKHTASGFTQMTWDENVRAVQRHAEALVASEMDWPLKIREHVESVGLAEVVYPGIDDLTLPSRVEAELPNVAARTALRECWPSFVHLLLDSLRSDRLVGWSITYDDESRQWLGRSPLTGRWAARSRGGWGAHAFVGARDDQRRRAFAASVLRKAGCAQQEADRLAQIMLEDAFDQLHSTNALRSWLQVEENHQLSEHDSDKAIRIALDRLSVRWPTALYRCRETGTVWTRSALGWTWAEGCQGRLEPVSEADLDNDPRWGRSRRELLTSEYFSEGLWGEEHSAQLDPRENRRLQGLFKHGVRNILSSTTTMELGVDIGGLNGVLLGNVPPGPANHLQRAGRAGRRSDGSAVVVTYARDSAYDREVFRRFGAFLQTPLRRPTVFLHRRRIVQRHLQAVLLSEFLSPTQPGHVGAMGAYGTMGRFCGVDRGPEQWRQEPKPTWNPPMSGQADQFTRFLDSLATSPRGMDRRLADLGADTPHGHLTGSEAWNAFLAEARKTFDKALRAWRDDLTQLRDAWDEIPVNTGAERRSVEMAKAKAIAYQIRELCDFNVIEWLASYRFLPRYGFPVNLQRLVVRSPEPDDSQTAQEHSPSERYRLERGALLALNEYVPGSEVLVGGRIARSRGISKHWTDANKDRALGLDEFAVTCVQDHVFLSRDKDAPCNVCGSSRKRFEQLLFPRFGYTTAAWEPLERETDFEQVGKSESYPISFADPDTAEDVRQDFGGVSGLTVQYREGAHLLIRNAGDNACGFALCTRCGYAASEEHPGQSGRMNLPDGFAEHASIFSKSPDKRCWPRNQPAQTLVIRNRVIAARELTDMLLLCWPGATAGTQTGVFSLGRALVLAGTRLLELDHRELAMVTLPLSYPQLGIVVYDTSPGGCGHCTELLGRGDDWIRKTREILFVDDEHHNRCERACLDCILDFSGQHAANMLDRRAALTLLEGRVPAA